MKTKISLSTEGKAAPMSKEQVRSCMIAQKIIADFIKNQHKMTPKDTATVLTLVYDIVDVAKKVSWS